MGGFHWTRAATSPPRRGAAGGFHWTVQLLHLSKKKRTLVVSTGLCSCLTTIKSREEKWNPERGTKGHGSIVAQSIGAGAVHGIEENPREGTGHTQVLRLNPHDGT